MTEAATPDAIRDALSDQAQRPGALGPALWVLRLMQEFGQEDEARAFAIQRLRAAGAPTHPGATLLMEAALKAEVEHFLDGEQIFAEGDASHTLYCVMHGVVRLERLGVGVVARLPQGAAVGEVAALAKVHRAASAYAEGAVRVLALSPKLLGLLEAEAGPLLDLLRRIYQHRVLSQIIAPESPLAQLPAADRRWLVETTPDLKRLVDNAALRRAVNDPKVRKLIKRFQDGDKSAFYLLGEEPSVVALYEDKDVRKTIERLNLPELRRKVRERSKALAPAP